jgi:hypothetical protein
VFSQIGCDVARPKIVKIAGLAAADDSDRLSLKEIVLGMEERGKEQSAGGKSE